MRALAAVLLMLACSSWAARAQRAPAAVSLVDTPRLRIGPVEGRPETLFAGIVGARLLPSGEIAVADGGSHVIRFFDASGAHIRSIGREGAGPGEFRGLRWILACPSGKLLAVDGILGRVSVISSADGSVLRTVDLPSGLNFARYLSCQPGERLVVLLDRPVQLGAPGKVTRYPATLVRFALGSESRDTLVVLPGTEYYFASKVPGYVELPLGGQAMAASNGGRVYLAQNDEAMIQVIDLSSGRQESFEHRLPRPRITPAAWRSAKAERVRREPLARTRELLARVLAEVSAPDRYPPYTEVKADRNGRLWLRLTSTTSATHWRVVGPDGRHVGSVTLAGNVEPLDIGDEHLLAVERDSLGVEAVLLYTFPRPLIPR